MFRFPLCPHTPGHVKALLNFVACRANTTVLYQHAPLTRHFVARSQIIESHRSRCETSKGNGINNTSPVNVFWLRINAPRDMRLNFANFILNWEIRDILKIQPYGQPFPSSTFWIADPNYFGI